MIDYSGFNGIVRNAKGKSVLIISDLHFPYAHPDVFIFLKAIKKQYKPDIIVSIGDEVDGHAISFHTTSVDTEILNASSELQKATACCEELSKTFPIMDVLESNHGSLIFRRMKAEGIPLEYLKPLPDLYDVKWAWHEELILETKAGPVYLCHGKTTTFGKLCKEVGMSAIQGHYHGKFSINWFYTPLKQVFDMFCGCLIDYKSRAFEYGKNHLQKPIIGVGFIDKDGIPQLIKMKLNKAGRWTKKL